MKRFLPSSIFAFLMTVLLSGTGDIMASNDPQSLLKQQNTQAGFIENKGQVIDQHDKPNPSVLYLLNIPGMNVQLRKGGFNYDLYQECGNIGINSRYPGSSIEHRASSIQFHRIDINLIGSNPDAAIITSAPSAGYYNYYTTGTPTEGVTNVRSFSTITYKNIYPGIDLQFTSENGFEYNFILQPGADIKSIKLKINGPEKIKLFREGIRCETTLGGLDETIPVCYYSLDERRVPVKGRFKKIAEHLYGFAVDKRIPSNAVLLIDPVPTRRWGTYFGNAGFTQTGRGTIDNSGNCILTGFTSSTINIATSGAHQVTLMGDYDAFLEKFSSVGQRIWGTYYGGTLLDMGEGCTVDRFGDIILVGTTLSTNNIATPGAYQQNMHKYNDGFIAKFTSAGQRIWASYYGGNESLLNQNEAIYNCCTDTSGNIYFAGVTTSPDFISSPGAHQPNYAGMEDCFLVKFSPGGQRIWGTYYGGSDEDQRGTCTITKDGFLYLSGETQSPDNIATAGSFLQTYNGFLKGFLAAFDTSGQRLWGTYYGGENKDAISGCTADTNSNVYICGHTLSSSNISTPGVFQENQIADSNAFIAKFNPAGQRIWGTYYGAGNSGISNISLDDSGYVFIAGATYTQDPVFAPPGAYQTVHRGPTDLFFAKFSSDGTQRIWGSYYGGMGYDNGWIVTDHSNNIFVSGNTTSDNNTKPDTSLCMRQRSGNYLATPGSFQPELMFSMNVFLVKFSDCYSPDTATQIYGPTTLCQNTTGYVFSIDPLLTATDYHWCVTGDLTITSGQGTTSVTIDVGPMLGIDTISVYGINSCDNGFPKLLMVNVVKRPVPVITGNTSPLAGTTQTYSTETGKTNYQWTFSPGGSLVSGGGVNDPAITILWNTSGAQWVRVSYTDVNGCMASAPTQLDINVTTSVTIDFTAPDTVCTGGLITVTNLTQGGTTFYWNFCSGNANNNPTGINIGNPGGLLSVPTYITLVKQHDSCFSFISCQGVGVIRYYHGSSFANNPVSWTNLGQFGLLGPNQEGIQVKLDNGNWYGFVNNNNSLVRLNFGNSLMNTPTPTSILPFPPLNMAHGLEITKEGSTWVGFITCSTGQKLVQLNFGNSLTNIPVATDFGNVGGSIVSPSAICLVQENALWYAMIMSGGTTLTRITFGNSLLNVPTGVNLGNPGGFNNAGGLTLLRDCSSTTGYWTNYLVNGQLGKLTFPNGILGTVSGTILGNIGGLAQPHSFSELFRQNDTLFAYITNRTNGTLTRLTFPPCTNSSVGSSNLYNPPPFSYNQPGTYNIHLIVDEGLPTMASLCKPVVVMNMPVLNLGPDKSVCPGNTTLLDAGPGFTGYLWSTGATTRTVTVPAGTYWVNASRWGCTVSDTIIVSALAGPSANLGPDTTICSGQTVTFDAGPCAGCTFQWSNLTLGQMNIGNGQTYTTGTAAKYMVTVTDLNSCSGRDTVQLFVTPINPVTLSIFASDNDVCAGTLIHFLATAVNPGTLPVYQWFVNGSPVGVNSTAYSYVPLNGDVVTCSLLSNIPCPANNPATSQPITMIVNANLPVTVSISASSNPFCPGNPVTFTATPGSGGPTPSYQWKVNGISTGPNSQTFIYTPSDGDLVSCIMTSSDPCTTGNPATSNTLLMAINNNFPAGVTISANPDPFCPGTSVTFTALPFNGGPNPIYQWKVNGANAGINSDTYSYSPVPGDSVRCIMTSNLPCVSGSPVSSATIILTAKPLPVVSFYPCFDTITTLNAKPIKLKGGIPLGGTYSGPGVSAGYYFPNIAGNGMHVITYSYTNISLCTASKNSRIHQFASSPVNCGSPFMDIRDNHVYQTVQLGSQCWLASNLNFGMTIASTQDQRDNCIAEKYCYNDNPANCLSYGGLYQWDELMLFDDTPANQGFCPPGWHIPTENDWNTLFAIFINNGFAGSPLKYSGYSGFNAILSGARHINRGWDFQGFATFFWSSTGFGGTKAWAHGMNDPDPSVSFYPASRVNAFSVRCLKD